MTIRTSLGVLASTALALYACGGTATKSTTGAGGSSGTAGSGSAGTHGGGGTTSGAGGMMAGMGGMMAGMGGMMAGMGGMMAGMGGKPGPAGQGGMGGAITTCTPGLVGSAIVDCGYPYKSSNPLTSVVFSEDEVLRAIEPSGGAPLAIVRVFYNDEHALTLGVHQVVATAAGGPTMTDYPVSPLTTDPGTIMNAQTGTNMLSGPQSGLDQSLRPMWPVLFITDITSDLNSRSGDWQQGGRPVNPTDIFGTWKGAVRTVDTTVTPNTIKITPDADPKQNKWNLGPGADPVPAGLTDQGWGAEVRWSVPLTTGHSYRIQAIVHDGDQNKAGGDSGEACAVYCAGGGGEGEGGAGGSPPPAMCPAGVAACGPGGIDPANCPAGTVCANGCCLNIIP
jgi:hypothetical protein